MMITSRPQANAIAPDDCQMKLIFFFFLTVVALQYLTDHRYLQNYLRKMSHLIGIDLGATNAKAAVVTKDGKVIANVQESLGIDLSPDAVVSKLVKCASRALKEVEMDWKDVAGV